MFYRLAACALLLVPLSGCDVVSAAFTSTPQKVNNAAPVSAETETAFNRLLATLEGDSAAKKSVETQFDQLLKARAFSCSALVQIGRFDTPKQVKAKLTDKECFAAQEGVIQEWIGARRLALLIQAPPLAPLAALPPRALIATPEGASQLVLADDANVLVFGGGEKFTAVQVPDGKRIGEIKVAGSQPRPLSLSPNGRIVAIAFANGLRFHDVATGEPLWTASKYASVLTWLPEVDGVVLMQSNTGAPFLLDIRQGKVEPYASMTTRPTWAVTMPQGQRVVGAYQTAALIGHARNAVGGIAVTPIKQWSLGNVSVQSGTPLVMGGGKKLVYVSGQNVSWLDTDSGQVTSLQTAMLNVRSIAKTSESTLMFDGNSYGASGESQDHSALLDIDKQELSTARDVKQADGLLMASSQRTAFIKRGNGGILLGTTVEGDNPQSLEGLIAQADLTKQLRKLEDAKREEEFALARARIEMTRPGASAAATADMTPAEAARARHLSMSQARGAAEQAAAFAQQAAERARVVQAAGLAPGGAAAGPILAGVPANAKVAFVGVYEAVNTPGGGRAGNVRVNIAPGSEPLVLVLSNYEPVTWTINTGGRKIAAVLLSSYNPATVVGAEPAQVMRIGSNHAYKLDSEDYAKVQRDVTRYVGKPVSSFQGGYRGQEFTVR
ncbi:PQQ-binding-like beta-propeller repeat protein [Caenimonas koreensis DSM 17982]|uniref:PQQ-binding-like beta-propeller repeat protein n=1 Tax=Caenimonas koreensis DSM 17982 TaxID=1121255 RepID=A0A844AW71_9BURK|nr:PQQ-binding-like beta-propeller repeat protein [Caenimonas koreensis]MRD46628.1 PQQ-binding-like beta-propeller repeat protein [Caenimonas koreensis DSM 17982]